MLLTSSVLSTTSKLYFEQPAARFLVCSLIFIEYTTVDLIKQKNEQMSCLFVFDYVTISPSRSVRCETNKPPAMRVRVEGYTKKTPNAIQ